MSQATELKHFLSPRSIAIVGASGNFGSISGKPLRYLKEHGYQGKIFPINPKYEELGGYPCYKSILDVPEPVDLSPAEAACALENRELLGRLGLGSNRSVVIRCSSAAIRRCWPTWLRRKYCRS